MKSSLCFVFLLILLLCCCRNINNADYQRLVTLDSITGKQPIAVLDSLKHINTNSLSSYNKAYYQLLSVIAHDKAKLYATNDSLINVAKKGLSSQENSHNYARALLYQGVVRYRMQVYDSTTILPIKNAIAILENLRPRDNDKLHIAYYYLADTHYKHDNNNSAYYYLNQSLYYAKAQKDSARMLHVYLELCWNRLNMKAFDQARLYLDTSNTFPNYGVGYEEFRENTKAGYYTHTNQPEKAIEVNRKILNLDLAQNDKKDLHTDYYAISQLFMDLHKLDSARKYSQLNIKAIQDTASELNYFYYLNGAEIAEQLGKWHESTTFYKNSFHSLKQSINYQTNTQLQEAEKRYDKSKSEQKALELLHHNRLLNGIIVLVVLMLVLVYLLARQRKLKQANRIIVIEQQKLRTERHNLKLEQELQVRHYSAALVQRDNDEKYLMLELFQFISHRYADTQKTLQGFSNKLIVEYPSIYERLKLELDMVQKEFLLINHKFIDDTIFNRFTGMDADAAKLTDNEKTLLVLLSCNATNKQIALLLGTNLSSLRVRRYNLKTKLLNLDVSVPERLFVQLNTSLQANDER